MGPPGSQTINAADRRGKLGKIAHPISRRAKPDTGGHRKVSFNRISMPVRSGRIGNAGSSPDPSSLGKSNAAGIGWDNSAKGYAILWEEIVPLLF